MEKLILFSVFFTLCACTSMHSSDPDSLSFSIPEGSILSLNKKLTISQNNTHATIQYGKETTDNDRYDYDVNCRLDLKKFGPRIFEPEDFKVSRTEDGSNWVSQPFILRFYTEIYLISAIGSDVIKMVCQQYGDQTDYHFTVHDIEVALGDFFSFSFIEGN